MNLKPAFLAAFGVLAAAVSAAAVEEPPFQLVSQAGDFEIRDYPALTVAETIVDGDRDAAAYAGFRRLAGYIFGGNAKKESIEMTAPVIEARPTSLRVERGPRLAWVIRFVMPRGYRLTALPKPDAEGIVLREEPQARMAILRFSGLAGDDAVAAKTAELEAMLKSRNLVPAGPSVIAQYDPPWTLPFLRRNEIMIPLRKG